MYLFFLSAIVDLIPVLSVEVEASRTPLVVVEIGVTV